MPARRKRSSVPAQPPNDQLLTIKQLREKLGNVSRSTIYRYLSLPDLNPPFPRPLNVPSPRGPGDESDRRRHRRSLWSRVEVDAWIFRIRQDSAVECGPQWHVEAALEHLAAADDDDQPTETA